MTIIIERSAGGNLIEVDIEELSNFRWDNVSGGYHVRQRGYSLFADFDYNLGDELGLCSGRHFYFKSDIKVMIPKSANQDTPEHKKAYKLLAEEAGEKPKPLPLTKQGFPPLTKYILSLLSEHSWKRGALRDKVISEGYKVDFAGAIKRLEKQKKIKLIGSSSSKFQEIYLA